MRVTTRGKGGVLETFDIMPTNGVKGLGGAAPPPPILRLAVLTFQCASSPGAMVIQTIER